MDNKPNQSLFTNNKDHQHHDHNPKKTLILPTTTVAVASVVSGAGDRLKRDEWSEGAVSSLLEAYEAKWVLRNRAKLKGHDWEDVAKHVSSRAGCGKSPKTQTQCKNKIESMKKRYRSESAASDVSSWPLFPRLDLLLRGNGGASVVTGGACKVPVMTFEHAPPQPVQTLPPPVPIYSASTPVTVQMPEPSPVPVNQGVGQNSVDSNDGDRENKEDALIDTKLPDHQTSEKMEIETDCSTPALYSNDKAKPRSKNHKTRISDNKKRRRKDENWDVAESIRWLTKVMVRSEQLRVDTMRELEKMRADAELKRGEIDLKRTEIIAHTQLEIARLFATTLGKGVDPSLRIGRS